jgi:hypothetical protein
MGFAKKRIYWSAALKRKKKKKLLKSLNPLVFTGDYCRGEEKKHFEEKELKKIWSKPSGIYLIEIDL